MKEKWQLSAIVLAVIVFIVGCFWINTYMIEIHGYLIQQSRFWYIVAMVVFVAIGVLIRKK